MNYMERYDSFLIREGFDKHIKSELLRIGIEDKDVIDEYIKQAHRGNLANHLKKVGKKFTFGMLNSLFVDATDAKRKTDIRVGILKAVHRILPMALAPFFPILAIVGYILGTSRAFNKIIAPILADPGKDYPDFLNKLVINSMKIAEGEIIQVKDRFSRAFVVSDNITEAIREEVLREFALYLSKKMERQDPDTEVPDFYIENELKKYLNRKFDIYPEIPIREN
jgi:hypothetical protein